METIVANVTAKARKATLNGRAYLVAPATLIVPGVLPGSQGRIYYPPDEVERSVPAWNGMPLVGYHPTDSDGGFLSARTPEVLARQGIGAVYNAGFPQGKLAAELWYDELLTKAFDATLAAEHRIVPRLVSGGKIEVSTGLGLKKRKPAEGEVLNLAAGVSAADFDWIGSDYRPDHVATLPDQKGACSVSDGCGVFNGADERRTLWQKLGEAMSALWKQGGELLTPAQFGKHVLGDVAVTANEMSHEQLRDALQRELKSRFTQADPYCYVCEVYDGYFIFEQGMKSYRLDYSQTDAGVTMSGDPVEVVRQVEYVPTTGEATMNRTQLIDFLVANCDCWKGANDRDTLNNRDTLNKLPDDKLAALKAAAEQAKADAQVANAAKSGFRDANGTEFFWDAKAGYFDAKPKPAEVPVAKPVTNETRLTAEEAEDLAFARAERTRQKQAMIDRLTANVADAGQKAAAQAVYAGMKAEQLAPLVAALPAAAQQAQPQPAQGYWGGAVPPPVTANVKDDSDNLLPPMVFDFADAHQQQAKKQTA